MNFKIFMYKSERLPENISDIYASNLVKYCRELFSETIAFGVYFVYVFFYIYIATTKDGS